MWKLDCIALFCVVVMAFFAIRPMGYRWWVKGLLVGALLGLAPRYCWHRLFQVGLMSPDGMPMWLVVVLLWQMMFLWCGAVLSVVVWGVRLFVRRLSPWVAFGMAGCLATVVLMSGLRREVPVVEHCVVLQGLPPEAEGMRIVVLADMHIDSLRGEAWCARLVERVNGLAPDVVLFTGDQSDGGVEHRAKDLAPLKDLHARLGVYAISGNHECWFDEDALEGLLASYGVQPLDGRHVTLRGVTFVGVGDTRALVKDVATERLAQVMATVEEGAFPVLLVHKPAVAPVADRMGVRLQLSGHTHGGQLPLLDWWIASFNGGFVRGWYTLAQGMQLFVAPGCGVWSGFPYRFFASEITVLTLSGERAQ